MLAKKCDRCGQLYEINASTICLNKSNKCARHFEPNISLVLIGPKFEYYTLDLCPVCCTNFQKWFTDGKEKEK